MGSAPHVDLDRRCCSDAEDGMELKDQVAVVTGGGQGIGKAIALRLATEGASVAIIDSNGETANATAESLRESGHSTVSKVADVSDFEGITAAVDEVAREFERIDVLVNNAGVERRAPFFEITPDDWQRQLDVNVSGTFYCTQACAREMAARKYGRVVNIASVAGLIGPRRSTASRRRWHYRQCRRAGTYRNGVDARCVER